MPWIDLFQIQAAIYQNTELTLFYEFQLPSDPIDIEDYDMGGVLATPKPVKVEMRPRF